SGAAVPWQLRLPRGRPARDARRGRPARAPRLDAAQGDVQLSVGQGDVRRAPARRALDRRAAQRRSGRIAPDRDLRMAPARMDYEPAGELKIGQVGIANLRVKTLDIERLAAEMRERVARAPKLFARAAMVLDFGGLSDTPDRATAQALVDALREAGVLPVALAYGTSANDALAQALGLPLLAKFRASYEPVGGAESHHVGAAEAATAAAATSTRQAPAAPVAASAAPTREPAPVAPTGEPVLVQA